MKLEIAEVLRFNTSKFGDEQISFKENVDRMEEGQHDTSHITGESIAVRQEISVLTQTIEEKNGSAR